MPPHSNLLSDLSDSEGESISRSPTRSKVIPKKKKTYSPSRSEENEEENQDEEEERKETTIRVAPKSSIAKPLIKSSIAKPLIKSSTTKLPALTVARRKSISPTRLIKSKKESPIVSAKIPKVLLDQIFEFAGGQAQLNLMKAMGNVFTKQQRNMLIDLSTPNLIDVKLIPSQLQDLLTSFPNMKFEGLYLDLSDQNEKMDWSLLTKKETFLKYLKITAENINIDFSMLKRFTNLLSLEVDGAILNSQDIEVFTKLQILKLNLSFIESTTQGLDLTVISKLKSLKELELIFTIIDEIGDEEQEAMFLEASTINLSELENMDVLTTISITNFSFTDTIAFPGCFSLKNLSLKKCNFDNLNFLSDQYQLTSFTIEDHHRHLDDLNGITTQQQLELISLLGLNHSSSDILLPLAECSNLNTIIFKAYPYEPDKLSLDFVPSVKKLHTLNISGKFNSLSPLQDCLTLKVLNVKCFKKPLEMKIPSVNSKYTGLSRLKLQNVIFDHDDMDVIITHTHLQELELIPNKESSLPSLDKLSELLELRSLYLGTKEEDVTNFSFLPDMSSLENLELNYMEGDFTLFSENNNLISLKIQRTNLQSLEGIQVLTKLENLSLFSSSLMDVRLLSQLKALKSLELQNFNKLKRFVLSDDMPSLTNISISGSPLQMIAGMEHCYNLEILNLRHTELKELTGLSKCVNLRKVNLDDNLKLVDIYGLSRCVNLENITLDRCEKLMYIFPLDRCTKLKRLSLDNAKALRNVSFLTKLPDLEYVNLARCENITDLYDFITTASNGMTISLNKYREKIHGGNIEAARRITELNLMSEAEKEIQEQEDEESELEDED